MWEELIQEAYSLMDDDDEFLSELPVPKSGVFCLVMLLPYEEDDLKK